MGYGEVWFLRRAILVLSEFWISAFRSNFTPGLAAICSWDAGQDHRAVLDPSRSIKRPSKAQFIPVMCLLHTLCFRCFPFLAASFREPALKWMIACDRRIKSINPALIKQRMMNQERQLWAHLCCHLNRIKALNHRAAPGNRREGGRSNTMCDRAALLPADLITPEGGGGAGINENLSKVLKYDCKMKWQLPSFLFGQCPFCMLCRTQSG